MDLHVRAAPAATVRRAMEPLMGGSTSMEADLTAELPWNEGAAAAASTTGALAAASAGLERYSVPELVAACAGWEATGGSAPAKLVLHGQLTSRRKLAKDLIFFDVQEPGASVARLTPAAAAVMAE